MISLPIVRLDYFFIFHQKVDYQCLSSTQTFICSESVIFELICKFANLKLKFYFGMSTLIKKEEKKNVGLSPPDFPIFSTNL